MTAVHSHLVERRPEAMLPADGIHAALKSMVVLTMIFFYTLLVFQMGQNACAKCPELASVLTRLSKKCTGLG